MANAPPPTTKPPEPDAGVATPPGDVNPAEPAPKRPAPRYAAFERRKRETALPTEPVVATIASEAPSATSLKTWLALATTGIVIGGCLVAYIGRKPPAGSSPASSGRSAGAGLSANVAQPGTPTAPVVAPQLAQGTRDTAGRLIRIVGSDPGSVLGFFCAAGGPQESRMPIGVREATVPRRGARLGVLRLGTGHGELAIWIRRDERTGKWIAGNDRDPITARSLADVER
jgi:hypothetical protein